jgi:selenide,water dikinase
VRRFAEHSRSDDPNLLLGLDAPDDAAVYRIGSDLALVQTVDFFTPIVDDPYDWGLIAAANAFSDVYAMAARPLLALNLVGWPMDLDAELLARLLEGGADKAAEAGVAIVGGHTIDDQEPKYGMAVTGTVDPALMTTMSSAHPGCALVLTKPLSMGIISTALKREEAPADLVGEATRLMATLNAAAAEAVGEIGAAAVTDVTGFGLMGHLHLMARSSGVAVELTAGSVPVLDGVRALAEKGLVPGGTRRNESHFSQFVEFDGVDAVDRTILFDAQTSGGLLIAVDQARADAMVEALEKRSTPVAAVIGRTVEGEPGSIRVSA